MKSIRDMTQEELHEYIRRTQRCRTIGSYIIVAGLVLKIIVLITLSVIYK